MIRRFLKKSRLSYAPRKKIVLVGGSGTIGALLEEGLSDTYDLTILDISEPAKKNTQNYVKADAANLDQLMAAVPDDSYAVVNLTQLHDQLPLPDGKNIRLCSDVYVVGAYNILLTAVDKGIGKVVFASTNHVTGAYEADGRSSIGREIRTDEYPLPDSTYGAMKLCAELFGYLFSREKDISVICLRIGTVVEDELSFLRSNDRAHRTLLSRLDTVDLFRRAIETNVKYGVYYGVSDNPGKPWDISNAIKDIGFHPTMNSEVLLKEGIARGKTHVRSR